MSWPEQWVCAGAGFVLALAGLGGGGQGGLGDTAAQVAACGLVAMLAWFDSRKQLEWRAPLWVRCLPLLALALPLLQLLPIGAGLWDSGPARGALAQQLRSIGVVPIGTISLNPAGTERALLGLLPACALYLATLTLGWRTLRRLLVVVMCLAVGNVLLGIAQLGEGRESGLRLYFPTNTQAAVGLFANRNHLACLLTMCLPLALSATAWALVERLGGRRVSPLLVVAGCGVVMLLVVGITMTGSRAGLLLGMLSVLGSWPIAAALRPQSGVRRVLLVTLVLAFVLAVQLSLVGVLQRLNDNGQEDGRWEYARVTSAAARDYMPLGSGLGTFRQAYQPYEAKAEPARVIINHAHNDYLELWLEGGVPALVLLTAGLLAWASRGISLVRARTASAEATIRCLFVSRTAWLSASLGLVHSALDYPLRTTAAMTVFALLAGVALTSPANRLRSSDLF